MGDQKSSAVDQLGASQSSAGDDDAGRHKINRKEYEKELRKLQTELCSLQDWVKATGARIIVIFEGRDAAGKGGTIRTMTERVRAAPSDREKSQMYVQRYLAHFPAAVKSSSTIAAGTTGPAFEYVMGFCTERQHKEFLEICPKFEKQVVDSGIRLIKYWLEVGNKEQKRRFEARIDDRLRQWKLSPIDLPSRERWYDYSRARDMMLAATDTDFAPWYIVRSDDKERARLNVLSHFLSLIPYEAPKRDKIKLPACDNKSAYDDEATIKNRRWIDERY